MALRREDLAYLGTGQIRHDEDGRAYVDQRSLRFDDDSSLGGALFGDDDLDDLGGIEGFVERRRPPMVKTPLTARSTPSHSVAAGATETFTTDVVARPQFAFEAEDAVLTSTAAVGAAAGTSLVLDAIGITKILFGDNVVWQNASPVPLSVLAETSFLRALVRGMRIRAGLDITITLSHTVRNTDAGGAHTTTYSATAAIFGLKEMTRRC